MASLLELTERINKGELIDPQLLEVYQDSSNAAEKFLANHAGAMLDLRRSYTHLLEALEAVDYADQKVLFQFLSVLGFLGMSDQRTRPVLKFGAAAIGRREIGLGLEALQSSITADLTHDGPFVREADTAAFVAKQYERAAAGLAWYPPGPANWENPQLRIGYVTTTLSEDEPYSRTAGALARHLDAKQFKLHVYATEAAVRREKQSFTQGPFSPASSKKGRETIDLLTRRRATLWFAPLDHDLATCAKDLATQIFKDQIDVLIIDAGPADPIAAVLACWKPAKAKLLLARRVAIKHGEADAVAYFDGHRRSHDAMYWQKADTLTHLLPDGFEPLLPDAAVPQRSAYGIPDNSVILSTILNEADGPVPADFIDSVIALLRQHPNAVLLTAGCADTSELKRRLDAAGLGKRAGFTGRRRELAEFVKMSDVYLVPFGRTGATGLLAAITAHKPVVALPGDGDPQSPAGLLDGDAICIDAAAYIDRAGRLIRDPQLRARAADASRHAAARGTADQSVRAIESLCRSLIDSVPTAMSQAA
ncbi:MAG: glycosyltransferase [Tepidisphaeraceae bacterium]